jgi:hypothetical protein
MASQETIRLMSFNVAVAQTPEFEIHLINLFAVLKEYFETSSDRKLLVELVEVAMNRPPDS